MGMVTSVSRPDRPTHLLIQIAAPLLALSALFAPGQAISADAIAQKLKELAAEELGTGGNETRPASSDAALQVQLLRLEQLLAREREASAQLEAARKAASEARTAADEARQLRDALKEQAQIAGANSGGSAMEPAKSPVNAQPQAATFNLSTAEDRARVAEAHAILEHQREEEAANLSAKLASARARYGQQTVRPVVPDDDIELKAQPAPSVEAGLAPTDARPMSTPPSAPVSTRVTMLLVMTPGHKGIRRYDPTADPVLCLADTCYVSRGEKVDARPRSRLEALGPGNTFGKRAEACNRRLACVFRNIDLDAMATQVQPVDLHIIEHDRREVSTVSADTSCYLALGHLRCGQPIDAKSYRLWVVPEALANQVGGEVLDDAVQAGLPDEGIGPAHIDLAHR